MFDVASKKTEQDRLKAEGSKLYSAVLREIFKLLLNSLSGKFLFSHFLDETVIINMENGDYEALR
jgi:hypothetical protein